MPRWMVDLSHEIVEGVITHPGFPDPRSRPTCVARSRLTATRRGTTSTHEFAPDVYCLGPRGRTQTNAYLVRSGSSWALIDAGWGKDGPSIKQAAETVFGADARLSLDPADALPPRSSRQENPPCC